ncbi:MAG: ankyrin repeat domain-containing protein [Polyangiales bacterium]
MRSLASILVSVALSVAACTPAFPPNTLAKAIQANDLALFDQSLDRGVDLNKPDELGRPPLVLAASLGKVAMVEHLIAHGAKLTAIDASGQTALIAASAAGFPDVVKVLLDAGADPSTKDINGYTAHDWVNDQLGHAARGGDDLARERYFEIAALLEKARTSAAPDPSASDETREAPHRVPHSK